MHGCLTGDGGGGGLDRLRGVRLLDGVCISRPLYKVKLRDT